MFSKKEIHFTLIALCFLFYANILNNGFVSDDIPVILENPQLAFGYRIWYDPQSVLNSLSFHISRLSPFAYHAISIVLHSANTILVFWFLRLFFGLQASFIGACFFAVHPVHAEAVSWISGRPYLSLTFFILGTYLLYQRAANLLKEGKIRSGILIHLFALLFYTYFLINSFSFYALFPLLIILSDVTFGQWRKRWLYWLPFIALVACRIILAREVITQRIYFVEIETNAQHVFKTPLFYFIYSFFYHLWLLIWPARLSLYHEPVIFPPLVLKYSAYSLIPLAACFFITFRKAKELFFALGIFLIFLSPTYSHIPIASVVAERYIYFPSVALCLFIAFIYQRYSNRSDAAKRNLLSGMLLILLAFGIRTVARNEDYRSQERFWKQTIAVSPLSPRAHNNVGVIYLGEGNFTKAVEEFKHALRLNPKYMDAYNNIGVAYKDIGDKMTARAYFEKAVEANPISPHAYYNLGNIYNALGDKQNAVTYFKKAIALSRDYFKAYNDLGNVYESLSMYQEAIKAYNDVIQINPGYVNAWYNLGNLYLKINKKNKAIACYNKVLSIDLRHADTYNNLGNVYYELGQTDSAVASFKQALAIDRGHLKAYNNLANLYLKSGRTQEALDLLLQALNINRLDKTTHFNLAVAYFNQGEYLLANGHCREAMSLGYLVPEEFLKALEEKK